MKLLSKRAIMVRGVEAMSELSSGNDLKNKSKVKWLLKLLLAIFFVSAIFWLLSGICFGILVVLIKWHHLKVNFVCDWQSYLINPLYVFSVYGDWWQLLMKSLRHITINRVLFIPFIAIIGTLVTIFVIFSRQEYAIRLWYIMNFHFAKIKDIKRMGLFKNIGVVLGRFSGLLLAAKENNSVLCIGEMGSGKTSSVSIPSVLSADKVSVLAVDLTGILPQYTAGYRAKIGDIMYFNWDMQDDAENNIFYPRWNPLGAPNLPSDMEQRDEYVKRLSSYFVEIGEGEQENYWNLIVHGMINTIFNFWIVKVEQAKANDYFLEKLASESQLTREDKDLLLSYYIQMPKSLSKGVIDLLNDDMLTADNYLPIGSWGGVPEAWQGKNLCFAMITDWLIYNYENSEDVSGDDWYRWFRSLLNESWVFAYGNGIVDGLNQILHLSAKQRSLVFAQAIKPFIIFTDDSIRERTNGNDIDFSSIRGRYDEEECRFKPMTIYSLANTAHSKIINQIFIDEMMYYAMHSDDMDINYPWMVVLDDVGHNAKLRNLSELLENGQDRNISTLLLCNSLSLVANTYSRDELENMIMYTDYKIIKAADNRHLSQQMNKLASFSTRSVEIPQRAKLRKRRPYADATYFHRLAKDFRLCDDVKINTREYQIILMRGFYNRPIIADNIFFAQDERFGKLSEYPANYTLSLQRIIQKQESDLQTPSINYLLGNNRDKSAIYNKIKKEEKKVAGGNNSKDEWWLAEGAFKQDEMSHNPFENKE